MAPLTIHAPRSRSGHSITLRAEMDLIVGLTACSAELASNGRFKPIEFDLRRRHGVGWMSTHD
jgi:uncharacterized protein YcgI (DUF1989 family)